MLKCIDHVGNYILVLEYANGGNLREYLSNKERFGSLRWKDKIQMALDITCGLKCLHSKEIIHRDLVILILVINIFFIIIIYLNYTNHFKALKKHISE